MKPANTVAITLVNYDTKDLALHCLKKIYEAEISVPFQIIFVDNKSRSSVETVEAVSEQFPEVVLLPQEENLGYTKGLNVAVEAADAEYIFNLNSDAVLEKGSIESMIGYMREHPEVGILGPQLLNFDGSIQESAYRFLTLEIALYRRTPLGKLPFAQKKLAEFTMKDWDHNTIKEVDWILGAAIMFRKDRSAEVGHLDESMYLYLSDTYFAWQMWKKGYSVVYYPEVKLYHYHRKSSRDQFFLKKLFFNRAYRIHIKDGLTYFRKIWGKENPHTTTS